MLFVLFYKQTNGMLRHLYMHLFWSHISILKTVSPFSTTTNDTCRSFFILEPNEKKPDERTCRSFHAVVKGNKKCRNGGVHSGSAFHEKLNGESIKRLIGIINLSSYNVMDRDSTSRTQSNGNIVAWVTGTTTPCNNLWELKLLNLLKSASTVVIECYF